MEADCCGAPAASRGISVFQQTARYGSPLRPAAVMVAATPTSRIKGGEKGTIHQNRNIRAASSLTVGYTGNARTNRSKSGQTWAALTLAAVQGVQHNKGISAPIALKQVAFNLGGGGAAQESVAQNTHAHRTKTGSI